MKYHPRFPNHLDDKDVAPEMPNQAKIPLKELVPVTARGEATRRKLLSAAEE